MIKIFFVKRASSGSRSDVRHVLRAADIYSWSSSANLYHCWKNILSDKVQWSHCVWKVKFAGIWHNYCQQLCLTMSPSQYGTLLWIWNCEVLANPPHPWIYPVWLVCFLWWRNHIGDVQCKSNNWNIPCSML